MQSKEQKKAWSTPQVVVHGDVETLTQVTKRFGANDGTTITGIPGIGTITAGS